MPCAVYLLRTFVHWNGFVPLLMHSWCWCRYDRTIDEDRALIADANTPVRQKVACRMLVCEKEILHDALDALMELPFGPTSSKMESPLDATNQYLKLQ